MRLLHISHLHLGAGDEQEYGLEVLREIVDHATQLEVDAVLVTGHLTTPGAALSPRARGILNELPCDAYVLPGAGETRRNLDTKRCKVLDGTRFDLRVAKSRDGKHFEILSIPNELSFWQWNVLPKNHHWRISLTNAGVLDLPQSLAEKTPGIDPELLRRLGVDYAAIGSVHDTIEPCRKGDSGPLVGCAGSARVTEPGEVGPRVAILVELDDGVHAELIPLPSAGQSRSYGLQVELDGEVPKLEVSWHANDLVELGLHGIIENEAARERAETMARERWQSKVRGLTVDTTGLVVTGGIIHTALARRLISQWRTREVSDPQMRILDLGIKAIGERP